MVHGVRYIGKDAIYLSKKHYCPDCKTELKKVNVSKVLNSNSEEAKNMPKILSRTIIGSRGIKFRNYNYLGNIKYVWKEFMCKNCHRHFTVEEMKEIEGVSTVKAEELSPEERKRIQRKKLIFNTILPLIILILIAIIRHLIVK